MLTKEQNDRFTRIGPGTPIGNLMQRHRKVLALHE